MTPSKALQDEPRTAAGTDGPAGAEARRHAPSRSVWAALSPRNIGAVYILVLIVVGFSVYLPISYPTLATVKQVSNGYSIIAMAALALVVPLATRTFDLSFAYVMTLSGVTAAHFVVAGLNTVLAMALGMLAAILIGAVNGLVVVAMKIDSFIGTLATGSLVQAFIIFFTNDQIITDVRLAGGFSDLAQVQVAGFTGPAFYSVLIAGLLWYVLEHTVSGRRVYAVGFNPDAARLATINVRKIRFVALVVSSAIAGFAGLCLASSLSAGSPTAGTAYLLPAFAAVFVGATQLKNGRFNAWGTLLAVVMLGAGTVGLSLSAAPNYAADMFTGVVLIAALAATGLQRRRTRRGARR
ncbi:ABC transporter permease [Saccharopolyspora phatthalungensis]|uniref:Ribose transport system permease protein n=1 Tax=Saccharopolyspora phatthalungensis TaxID=664693 RepID=A0A840QKI1_9PSEU|nr:ABC transporter permease [Saccharopolyspora phatthalungensis]MBB5158933.1 ribose transport system permease protein [Saccharopolyspora phatthalungensis]